MAIYGIATDLPLTNTCKWVNPGDLNGHLRDCDFGSDSPFGIHS